MVVENTRMLEESVKSKDVIAAYSKNAKVTENSKQNIFFRDSLESVSESNSVNMSEATYLKPESEAEDSKSLVEKMSNNAGLSELDRRNQMIILASTTSPEDYSEMEKDGFSMGDSTGRTIITETDKIKATLAKAGVDISIYGDGLSQEQLEEITGSKELATQISNKLKENDLPVNRENVESICKYYDIAQNIKPLSEDDMAYMIENSMLPTVENIYASQHSSTGRSCENVYDYMNEEEIERFNFQMEEAVRNAGLTTSDENMENARWLVENGLPLNGDNLRYLMNLKGFSGELEVVNGKGDMENSNLDGENSFRDKIIGACAAAISEGKGAGDGILFSGYSLGDRAAWAMDVVNNSGDAEIEYCINEGIDITLENLKHAGDMLESGGNGAVKSGDYGVLPGGAASENAMAESAVSNANAYGGEEFNIQLITARRQLEEVRLSMTISANMNMLKRGITIETAPMEQLIEELKNQEKSYYSNLLSGNGINASDENVSLFEKTTNCVETLKTLPVYGINLKTSSESLSQLHDRAVEVKKVFEEANNQYEKMMTTPRKDLGDSYKKAFSNIDDILKDLGLENNDSNRRAVRILAYNKDEITTDNINRIKACDEEVQRAFSNMTPKVTMEMIRQGINPLDMNISELNMIASDIRSQTGEDNERFSKYLWKLEKDNKITSEEKETYIGIYRLMAQVEKTDGAVIGSLLDEGAEITMRNLFSAVRTGKKGNMDYKIGDNFAGVDGSTSKAKIDEQIESAYTTKQSENSEEVTYQQNCVKDIMENLSPEALTLEGLSDWENLTVEQLKEMLMNQKEKMEAEGDNKSVQMELEYAANQLEEYSKSVVTSDEIYRFLDRYDVANTSANLAAARRIFKEPMRAFHELWDEEGGSPLGNLAVMTKLKEQAFEIFGEAIKNPKEMADAQETLADVAEHAMDNMIIEKDNISTIDIKEMKLINNQMRFHAQSAKEECYMIPMETSEGDVTGVSLKIIRGEKKKGMVDIFYHGNRDGEGKVMAGFDLSDKGVKGTVIVSDEKTLKKLQENYDDIIETVKENMPEGFDNINITIGLIPDISPEKYNLGIMKKENAMGNNQKSNQTDEVSDNQNSDYNVQTSRLYSLAEGFIKALNMPR